MIRSPFQGLRPVLGKGLQRLELAYVTADPQDKRQMEMAAELLRRSISPDGRPLLDPPDKKQADGEIWLGRIIHGERKLGWAGLERDQLCSHMGVFGTTGAGKTTACASVLLRLMELGVPWITLDPKRSLRCMKAMPTPKPVTVLSTGRPVGKGLQFNPFAPPPGSDAQSHIAEVIQLLSDTWHGGPAIASLLERAVRDAWKTTRGIPTFRDVFHALDAMSLKNREGQWMQSARRILATVSQRRLGRVFAPSTTHDPIGDLLTGWTIIETDGLTREEASFLVSTLLLQVHQRLLAGSTREKLKLVMMIDEAEQLLVKRDAHRESLIERMIRVSRESGLSICVASQSISKMTPTILQNLGTLIAMRAHLRDDVSIIARMLMLPDHATPLIGTLGVGQAVCRVPHWPSPIQIEVPKLQLPKGAVDDVVLASDDQATSKHHQLLEAIEYATVHHASGWSDSAGSGCSTPIGEHPPHQAGNRPIPPVDSAWSRGREHAESGSQRASDDPTSSTTDLLDATPDLQVLLRHIAVNPFATVTARYAQLSFSRRRGNALRQHLEELGLIKPIRIKTHRGMVMLLGLTDSARSWLKKKRAKITPLNGGIKHAFWQWEVKRLLEAQGWRVETEWREQDEDHAIDIAAWKDNRSLLIEVETGMSRWKDNLEALESSKAIHKAMLWIGEPSTIQQSPLELKSVTVLVPTQMAQWLTQLDSSVETS